MPDTKAHQFDPTRERLARVAMDQAEIGDDDLCCEPSAGTGGRAEFMPKGRTTCVEVSPQHCKVLAANGSRGSTQSVQELFAGRGKGSNLTSAAGTAWGLVNSVTEFVDHHRRARSDDHRLDAAWFGQGATLKQKAWQEALGCWCHPPSLH